VDKSHRVAIAEEGMKWKDVAIEPEKAQFLGLRKFQVTEAARILRIPNHLINDLERATFSNIEEQGIEFVEYSLRAWLVRWEQRIWQSLLGRKDRQKVFAEFTVEGLLRGDIQKRFQAYKTARDGGWMSPNEIRDKENQNPFEGGDSFIPPRAAPPATEARARVIIEAAARRVMRVELERLRAKAEKLAGDPAAWRTWVMEFYAEWPSIVAEQLQLEPAVARRYADAHRDQLLAEGISVLTTWTQTAARDLAALVLHEGDAHAEAEG